MPPADRSRSRAGRAEAIQRALLDAAVKVIGENGYADASIARITQHANVAQGTFYNYFTSQQQLFDELLPMIGNEMMARVGERRRGQRSHFGRERAGLRAFFDYLLDVPEFYRLLNEAETFAPGAHLQHTRNVVAGYVRALTRARADGALGGFAPREIEAIAYMLMGVRHYLAMRYAYGDGGVHRVPDWVVETYLRLLKGSLFTGRVRVRAASPAVSEPAVVRMARVDPREAIATTTLDGDATAESGVVEICRLAQAASVGVADAAHGPGHVVATFNLSVLAQPRAGVLAARAELRARAGSLVWVQTEISVAEVPVAIVQVALQLLS